MKRILVVAPHPDDEMIGVGGTIIRNIDEGNEVYVAVVTKGFDPLFDENIIEKTRAEARKCHSAIGIKKTFFLDFPSTMLDTLPKHKLNGALMEVVKEINPDEVYIPYSGDMHFDHGIVAEAAMVALRPKYPFAPEKIYVYETLSETGWNFPQVNSGFAPNVFVDISAQLDSKLDALSVYETQFEEFPAARSLQSVRALAEYRGALSNFKAAEAFMLVRSLVK
ncbi:MAG: PIG-L family deacetylase [Clostridia bacterium]|nr:PIG-L family deacetylase [Oscillospiraceae bacterium]MBQ7960090.1 PIG-L family deacetylase [Clostridia bacterium]